MNVKLLGINEEEFEKRKNENMRIASSAAALSRFKGKASEVYNAREDQEKNQKLIQNVIGYGHKTILDHLYLQFALDDVTPIVEQTIIQRRLSSFTIQSRREVNFKDAGFYVPEYFRDKEGNVHPKSEEIKKLYEEHMQSLFDFYGELVERGIDVEDARYILPYCFHANHIMGMDIRNLESLIVQLTSGTVSNITELKQLGGNLKQELLKVFPAVEKDLIKEEEKRSLEPKDKFESFHTYMPFMNRRMVNQVELVDATKDADRKILKSAIATRYQVNDQMAEYMFNRAGAEHYEFQRELMQTILKHSENRELEQVNFTFDIPISLAVLTHLTRHRMHSLLVPEFTPLWDMDSYVMPDDIAKEEDLREKFINVFEQTKTLRDELVKQGVNENDLVYFYLSGTKCQVRTTMNGRELQYFLKLRTCKKTQWETRRLANQMLNLVKPIAPLYGEGLGPNCEVLGECQEGKDNCKRKRIKY